MHQMIHKGEGLDGGVTYGIQLHPGSDRHYVEEVVAQRLLRELAAALGYQVVRNPPELEKLTPRQQAVLSVLDDMYRPEVDIARQAGIRTTWPVETARKHLFALRKLGLVEHAPEGSAPGWRLSSPTTEGQTNG